MLEKLPAALGRAMDGVRAGMDKLVWAGADAQGPEIVAVTSAAFIEGGALPASCTEDGDGSSPPLAWRGVPEGAAAVVIVVEDADSPTPAPIVHGLAYGLAGRDGEVGAGGLDPGAAGAGGAALGHNAFRKIGWLPPDPPKGHGEHRYVFQVYALDAAPALKGGAEKHDVVAALKGHVVARGRLVGTYQRPG